jgi:hypothetical protein
LALVNGAGIDPSDPVSNDELLYRRVLPVHIDCEVQPPKLRSEAFFDRDKKISVDRAEICGHDPTYTQEEPQNYVRCLRARKVREIDDVVTGDVRSGEIQHNIDVVPYPLTDNDAHAHIVGRPHVSSKGAFRKLRHSLLRLSSWTGGIAP